MWAWKGKRPGPLKVNEEGGGRVGVLSPPRFILVGGVIPLATGEEAAGG